MLHLCPIEKCAGLRGLDGNAEGTALRIGHQGLVPAETPFKAVHPNAQESVACQGTLRAARFRALLIQAQRWRDNDYGEKALEAASTGPRNCTVARNLRPVPNASPIERGQGGAGLHPFENLRKDRSLS